MAHEKTAKGDHPEDIEGGEREPSQEAIPGGGALVKRSTNLIPKLDALIEQEKDPAQKAELLFQKAELLWGLADLELMEASGRFTRCLEGAKNDVQEESCEEPNVDFSEARQLFKDIETKHPNYRRIDEVRRRLKEP